MAIKFEAQLPCCEPMQGIQLNDGRVILENYIHQSLEAMIRSFDKKFKYIKFTSICKEPSLYEIIKTENFKQKILLNEKEIEYILTYPNYDISQHDCEFYDNLINILKEKNFNDDKIEEITKFILVKDLLIKKGYRTGGNHTERFFIPFINGIRKESLCFSFEEYVELFRDCFYFRNAQEALMYTFNLDMNKSYSFYTEKQEFSSEEWTELSVYSPETNERLYVYLN